MMHGLENFKKRLNLQQHRSQNLKSRTKIKFIITKLQSQ